MINLDMPAETERAGARLSGFLKAGDFIALTGDLGSGKTTFARGLIRELLGQDDAEVPSPTFTLAQSYDTARIPIVHFDFYRIEDPGEVVELGVEEMLNRGIAIVEWPQKAPDILPDDFLEISFSLSKDGGHKARYRGHGAWRDRLRRQQKIGEFLERAGWGSASRSFLQGDASSRRYERLTGDGRAAILMDAPPMPDGPVVKDNKTYSAIAHLAETVTPFVALANGLRALGLSAPEILAWDLENGLLVLEDLGNDVFGTMIARGEDMAEPYREAVNVLIDLATKTLPADLSVPDAEPHQLPEMDLPGFCIETDLLLDWFWPMVTGGRPAPAQRLEFQELWRAVFEQLDQLPKTWALRDYHSPNLLWLKQREAQARIGIIDFQDAVLAPLGYDLVSLLQDARLDVPLSREQELLTQFQTRMKQTANNFNAEEFRRGYAIWGAQRNTKILGIFARLALRDGKPDYLRHLPRVSAYLDRNLSHPDLAELKSWFVRYLPADKRTVPAEAAGWMRG